MKSSSFQFWGGNSRNVSTEPLEMLGREGGEEDEGGDTPDGVGLEGEVEGEKDKRRGKSEGTNPPSPPNHLFYLQKQIQLPKCLSSNHLYYLRKKIPCPLPERVPDPLRLPHGGTETNPQRQEQQPKRTPFRACVAEGKRAKIQRTSLRSSLMYTQSSRLRAVACFLPPCLLDHLKRKVFG